MSRTGGGDVPGRGGAPGGGAAGPLGGWRVLVTRPATQAAELVERLEANGAEAVLLPTIRIADAKDGGASLRAAVAALDTFDWVILTSVNGVVRLAGALRELGATAEPARRLQGLRFGCIGPRTAAALRELGVEAHVVPQRYVAEGLVEALPLAEMAGRRVLLPRAAGARAILPERLEQAGAQVVEVEAYRAVADGRGAEEVRERLDRGDIDVLTFTSSSTVEQYAELMGTRTGGALVAAIGPITARTARALGLGADVVAVQHTIPGLVDALIEHRTNPSRRK